MLSVFFWGCFLETVPVRFFKVLSVLGFFFGGFFGTNFGMGVRSFWGGFLGPKMPFWRLENGEKRSSPFLRFFFGVLFLLRHVFVEGFGQRPP